MGRTGGTRTLAGVIGAGAVALAAVAVGGGGTAWIGTGSAAATTCAPRSDSYSSAVGLDKPRAYYRLDDPRGPTLCDASSNARPGTYASSGVTYRTAGAIPGDAAVAVTGASAAIGTGAGGSGLTGNHSFTFEAWFRSAGAPRDQSLVNMGQPGQGDIAGLSVWTSDTGDHAPSQLALDQYVGVPQAGANNIWDTGTVGVNLWDGRWHQVAIAYSAATGLTTGYVDGHRLSAYTPPAKVNLQASAVRVGYWVDTAINQPFVGHLDEVALYPSALAATRIRYHYVTSGAPLNTKRPAISGTPTVGRKLTSTTGAWSPSTGLTFRRQWELCPGSGTGCTAIPNATHPVYTPTASEVGDDLLVVVTATNGQGQKQSVSSAPVGPVTG